MKNTNKKGRALIIFLLGMALVIYVPEISGMGINQGQAPVNPQPPKSAPAASESVQVVIPAGTLIKVQLNQTIRTSTHRGGQPFFATLKEPLLNQGQVLVPDGVPLIGVISQSQESGHFSGSALIELQLNRIIMPDGRTVAITTDTYKSLGQTHLLRNIGLICIGSILGAGLGNLLGKIPAALIGIGFGGGVGAILAYITGKEDLFVRAGTDLDFKTVQPVTITMPPSSAIPSK